MVVCQFSHEERLFWVLLTGEVEKADPCSFLPTLTQQRLHLAQHFQWHQHLDTGWVDGWVIGLGIHLQ